MKAFIVVLCLSCLIDVQAQKVSFNDLLTTYNMSEADFVSYYIGKGFSLGHTTGLKQEKNPEFYGENGDVSLCCDGIITYSTTPAYVKDVAGVIRASCSLLFKRVSEDDLRNEMCFEEEYSYQYNTVKIGISIHQCESFLTIQVCAYDHWLFQNRLSVYKSDE